MRSTVLLLIWSVLILSCHGWAAGQTFDERFEDWPTALKIQGRLLVASELEDLQWLQDLLPSAELGEACLLIDGDQQAEHVSRVYQTHFQTLVHCSIERLEELQSDRAPQIIAWHLEPTADNLADASEVRRIAASLAAHLSYGRTVVMTGAAAALAGKFFWTAESPAGSPSEGTQLLPDCVLELGYAPSQSKRLLQQISRQRRCVGIGLEPDTLLLLDGRRLQVAGAGRAWLMLPAGAGLPSRVETLAPRAGRRHSVTHWLADLTEWRRDAIDRTLEPFPPTQPQPPLVAQGTLVIVGGGGMPPGLMHRFMELAGGPESARLVYIPCAEEEQVAPRASMIEDWQALGVQHTSLLHTKDRQQANTDQSFLAPLEDATGIWFGGGRQWNLADSYYGTTAHRLMKRVLQRGGVIGGSSAGASIQARYLARATPIENYRLMAPGYERGGLGFISGVAIDQHFSQRRRQPDMSQLVQRYPQLLGIGIDEATALIVQGSRAEITGQGAVFFYDAWAPQQPPETDYLKVTAGHSYDLIERRVVSHPSE